MTRSLRFRCVTHLIMSSRCAFAAYLLFEAQLGWHIHHGIT
jgi:hypothetical protein